MLNKQAVGSASIHGCTSSSTALAGLQSHHGMHTIILSNLISPDVETGLRCVGLSAPPEFEHNQQHVSYMGLHSGQRRPISRLLGKALRPRSLWAPLHASKVQLRLAGGCAKHLDDKSCANKRTVSSDRATAPAGCAPYLQDQPKALSRPACRSSHQS